MEKEGFILINKPVGTTSHDVIDKMREITKIKKIGHSGTLDPLASGLLILGIGRKATKKLNQFQKLDKEYLAKIKLGIISDTFDKEGKIKKIEYEKKPSLEEVKKVIQQFKGEIWQRPPLFSAKKVKGKKLYQLARKGIKIEPKKQKIKIYKIEIIKYNFPLLELKIHCSSGTYIRSLANDIGEKLKTGGCLESLKRTKIGNYSLENALKLDEITPQNWLKFLINCTI